MSLGWVREGRAYIWWALNLEEGGNTKMKIKWIFRAQQIFVDFLGSDE